jgi:hypothetical protein
LKFKTFRTAWASVIVDDVERQPRVWYVGKENVAVTLLLKEDVL